MRSSPSSRASTRTSSPPWQRARAIVRYGIGVDNVDLEAARARGIPVSNIPDYCIDEVADHTLAFILGLTRQVVTHTADLRAGQWRLAVPLPEMKALRDQTVGVVGFGRIGREVVRAAACRSNAACSCTIPWSSAGEHHRRWSDCRRARRNLLPPPTSSRCTAPRRPRRAASSAPRRWRE